MMPAPLIPILLVIVASVIFTAGLNWEKIKRALTGERIAILGQTKVGKTSLHSFLGVGWVPEKYVGTLGMGKTKGRTFQLKDLKLLLIKASKDVAGRKSAYGAWKKIVEESDRVLYLVRADLLLEGDEETEDRVERDTSNLRIWLSRKSGSEKGLKKPVAIIGTHVDLWPGFSELSGDELRKFEERFTGLKSVRQMVVRCGGGKSVPVILGSLETTDKARKLVYTLFKTLEGY